MKQQAVIYCRVSSISQERDGHGLESQESRCRHYAQTKGYEVAAVFPDTFTGGGDFMQRPGMVALLSFLDAQPNENFVVVFDDLKRASRDTRAFLNLRDAFRCRDVSVECLNFKFDDSPEGEFIETILAAQGALERKQNGRQVSQKMHARARLGYWNHIAPKGYRYETVKGHGRMLVQDEPVASIVREALEGYALGRFQTQAEVRGFLDGRPEFPRGRHGKRYPYYLCHTKGCEAYGKSIKRAELEGDVAEIIRRLEPAPKFMALAAAMFKSVWIARDAQARDAAAELKRQAAHIDGQIEKTLERILEANNATVVGTYERKIDQLQREKLVLAEKAETVSKSHGSFEEHLEPVLTFLGRVNT